MRFVTLSTLVSDSLFVYLYADCPFKYNVYTVNSVSFQLSLFVYLFSFFAIHEFIFIWRRKKQRNCSKDDPHVNISSMFDVV